MPEALEKSEKIQDKQKSFFIKINNESTDQNPFVNFFLCGSGCVVDRGSCVAAVESSCSWRSSVSAEVVHLEAVCAAADHSVVSVEKLCASLELSATSEVLRRDEAIREGSKGREPSEFAVQRPSRTSSKAFPRRTITSLDGSRGRSSWGTAEGNGRIVKRIGGLSWLRVAFHFEEQDLELKLSQTSVNNEISGNTYAIEILTQDFERISIDGLTNLLKKWIVRLQFNSTYNKQFALIQQISILFCQCLNRKMKEYGSMSIYENFVWNSM
ncbi:unnamed protein product, partial [Trichogramma brassicae]